MFPCWHESISTKVEIRIMLTISILQISLYIWSNALDNSTGNQHCPNHYFTIIILLLSNKSNQIKCRFLRRRENQSTLRKTSQTRVENQQLNPIMMPGFQISESWRAPLFCHRFLWIDTISAKILLHNLTKSNFHHITRHLLTKMK